MLTLDEIWYQLVKKDPGLLQENHKVEFTSVNLRKLLTQVYIQGAKRSQASNSILDEMNRIMKPNFWEV